MKQILFTKSNKPGSWLIRGVTKEPVSHCAVRMGNLILHSVECGVKIESVNEFFNKNKLIYAVPCDFYMYDFFYIADELVGRRYDFTGLLMLGLRFLFPFWVKKQDIRGISGSYICTELITRMLFDKEVLITPYQLYLKLKKHRKKDE